jgi:hypothetical protein
MVKRRESSEEDLFRFLYIDASEVAKYPTAIADMYERRLDGIIVRGVLPADGVSMVAERLERGEFGMNPLKFPAFAQLETAPHVLGRTLLSAGAEMDNYFSDAERFREQCRALFRQTVDFEQCIERVFVALSGGLPVHVPRDAQERSYTSATIRVLPNGHEIGIHVGNDFLRLPQCQPLAEILDTSDQLSYFVPLSVPDGGGELVVYALEWDDVAPYAPSATTAPPAVYESSHYNFFLMERFEKTAFRPGPGDLLIFDGGRYYHRVTQTLGDRPRRTIGGFLAFSKARDLIYYWS